MKLSVIICSRSGIPDRLKESLFQQSYKPYEIISIMGSSLTKQRNEGVRKSKGDLICFLDDDILLQTSYLENIVGTFNLKQDAMAVTGNVKVEIYKYNFLYDLFANIFLLSRRGLGRFRISGFPESYHENIDQIIKSEVLHGCNMTIKREVFKELSFNEDLKGGMFGEDDWFSWQMIGRYPVYYNPWAICYDIRPYPLGKQEIKVRCTLINLYRRYRLKGATELKRMAFWWSMSGFILFKTIEAVVMRDFSIIKGLLCIK